MPTPIKSVPIMLDRQRHILFSYNALCLLEDTLDLPIADIGNILAGSVKFGSLRAILYAGLSDDDPRLNVQEVGAILEDLNVLSMPKKLEEITAAVAKAFELAFPAPKKATGTEPEPGTGTNT